MRKLKFLTFLSLFGTVSLFGYTHPCPGGWNLEAYFLYLLPSIDDTYFVTQEAQSGPSDLPTGTRKNNNFDFRPGFRIGGAYAFCDCNKEFRVYYTRLHATSSRDVAGFNLSATQGQANDLAGNFQNYDGTASSRLDALYHRFDAFFDQKVYGCCGLDLYFEWGLEFASARLKEHIEYIRTDDASFGNLRQRAKTWGLGPQIGIEADYDICQLRTCCPGNLSLVMVGSASILASKALVRLNQFTTNSGPLPDLNNDHTWRLIPALHARVGLNYATCFSCFGLSLEVGYEFNSYIRSLSRVIFPDDVADGLSFNNFINFDLQGLYVAAGLTF